MKKPALILLIMLSCGWLAPTAHAQIVRRIIGHAIIGKAVKSAIGESHDKGTDSSQGVNPDGANDESPSAPAAGPAHSAGRAVRQQ